MSSCTRLKIALYDHHLLHTTSEKKVVGQGVNKKLARRKIFAFVSVIIKQSYLASSQFIPLPSSSCESERQLVCNCNIVIVGDSDNACVV